MPDYVNSVPLGEAGTGSAFLLPQSQTINAFNQYLDQQGAYDAANERNKQRQALALAKQWKDNQLKVKGGTLFQPEINSRANQVMQMGMDLQRQGVDPTGYSNDPKVQKLLSDYQTQKASLMRDADLRDELQKQAIVNDKLISDKPEGFFDPQSVQDYHDFLSGKHGGLSDISAKGLQMPGLKEAFNQNEAVDKLPTTPIETSSVSKDGVKRAMVIPNEQAHTATAHDFVINDPRMRADTEKKIGMPISHLPATSDVATIKKELDDHYRSLPAVNSLVAQGIKSFDVQDDEPAISAPGGLTIPHTKLNPQYDALITGQAKKLASAKIKYDQIVDGVKQHLDNKVHQKNDQSYSFEYAREMRERQSHGWAGMKFADWLKGKQDEEGETTPGNAGTYVPVVGTKLSDATGKPSFDEQGNPTNNAVQLQKGASLWTTRMPEVEVTLQPSTITSLDNKKGGRTYKNAEPIQMKVGGLKMVPVWTGVKGEDNDQEASLQQVKDVVSGKWAGRTAANLTYKPMVFGIQHTKDANNVHVVPKPIQIPYDSFKGGSTKKVNTKGFDQQIQQYQQILTNPEFLYTTDDKGQKRKTTPEEKLEMLHRFYNVQE